MLPVTTLVINISSVALIWFGGLRIDAGQMQVGSLIAFLSYFMQILMAVLLATFILVVLPRASVCAERITEVLSTEPRSPAPQHPVRPAAVDGAIRLDGATFSYPGADRPVLQDVSLTARPGTTTAIVGSTGSGKSTLVSLICRLYDVTVGVGARRRRRRARLRHRAAVVGDRTGAAARLPVLRHRRRQPALRQGRLRTDDEMWEALRVAAADDFVRAHADGLDMRVAQGGINFSGGQRQRLAIARAVIRRPAIYLFDDAFSALDVHTDARVRAALARGVRAMPRSSLSRSAFRRSPRPIRSSSSTTAGSSAPAPTSRCWPTAPTYARVRRLAGVGAGVGGDRDGRHRARRSAAWCRRPPSAPATSRARRSGWSNG